MQRFSFVLLLLALMVLMTGLAACGEPTNEDVRDRERDVLEYEADVEGMIGFG